MVSLNEGIAGNSAYRKFKSGDTRSDGFRFNQYQKRKNKDGSTIVSEQWLSPSVYENEREKRLNRDRERKRKLRENPEYRKRHSEYLKNQRNNPEYILKYNEYRRDKKKQRFATDNLFRLKCNIKCIIAQSFRLKKYKKNSMSERILGCPFSFLIKYIEARFADGMSWENRSKWHIDHIVPLSSAKTKKQLIKLNHYSNLRPIWAKDNLKKGSKPPEEQLSLI